MKLNRMFLGFFFVILPLHYFLVVNRFKLTIYIYIELMAVNGLLFTLITPYFCNSYLTCVTRFALYQWLVRVFSKSVFPNLIQTTSTHFEIITFFVFGAIYEKLF